MSWASPLLAAALMLVGGLAVFAALGKDPVEGFRVFFLNPVKDLYALSELLLKATPLMLCAIGLAIGFRANVWNIGAEGQFMLGAVAATGVALYFGSQRNRNRACSGRASQARTSLASWGMTLSSTRTTSPVGYAVASASRNSTNCAARLRGRTR